MKGKNKCKLLKQIRQKIADENDIPYITRECTYQGECKGTCPKCEQELRYLEQELEKRQRLGKAVAVAAVAAALSLGMGGCVPKAGSGAASANLPAQTQAGETSASQQTDPPQESERQPGRIEACPTEITDDLLGRILPTEEAYQLEGDISYVPETEEMTDPTDAAEQSNG